VAPGLAAAPVCAALPGATHYHPMPMGMADNQQVKNLKLILDEQKRTNELLEYLCRLHYFGTEGAPPPPGR